MPGHVVQPRTYVLVFIALLVLLGATLAAARVDLGPLNLIVWLTIAGIKATLVVLYFMHVRYASRTTWVFAAAGLLWFFTLLGLTLADYLSRGWPRF
jgi:cytochrome c oxidase subunit 4